jgi:adenine-specific DNA-methyltransferase
LALHSLKEEFVGKVKLIYIDPPYNTDNGGFNYNDSFSHSAWLSFMKNRLEVAKQLLRRDGVILVNSDEIEHSYLKILCDEIFGRNNFKGDFIWKKRKGGGNDSYFLALDHDYISVYTKEGSKAVHEKKWRVPYTEEYLKRYKEIDENGERYYWDTLARDGLQNPIVVNLKAPDGTELTVNSQKSESTIREQLDSGHVRFTETKNGWSLHHRVYMPEGKVARSILDKDGTNKTAKDELVQLFGESIFKYPKPETLLSFIISLFTEENDIVLDFFLGSGTTSAVAHKMERQFVGIEQMEYVETVAKQRLKKVVQGEQGGISEDVDWQGGGSFTYVELMQYNEQFIAQIEHAESTDGLQEIWNTMKEHAFLSYQINPSDIDENVEEFEALSLTDQKKFLVEVLDKNQLYVNYSEIENGDYEVSESDKKLNHPFYQLSEP